MGIKKMDAPADVEQLTPGRPVTNLMFMIWLSRPDLQQAFDIHAKAGQEAFLYWYDVSVTREYGLNIDDPSRQTIGAAESGAAQIEQAPTRPRYMRLLGLRPWLARASKCLPRKIREKGKVAWARFAANVACSNAAADRGTMPLASPAEGNPLLANGSRCDGDRGANLIGYAHAELGMGEHVRMSAVALSEVKVPFGVVNFNVRIDLDPTSAPIKLDMTTNTRIIGESHADVLAVPLNAIRSDAGGSPYVIVLDQQNSQRTVEVKTGLTQGKLTEVSGDLQAGEQVIINPTTRPTGFGSFGGSQ